METKQASLNHASKTEGGESFDYNIKINCAKKQTIGQIKSHIVCFSPHSTKGTTIKS
jgi:hypothetical protein